MLADAFEQLGYQAESTSVRNTFLQGAFELRNGLPGGVPVGLPSRTSSARCRPSNGSISSASHRSEESGGDALCHQPGNARQRKSRRRDQQRDADVDQGLPSREPDVTVTEPRKPQSGDDGEGVFDYLIKAGKAKFDGNRARFHQLRSILAPFTPDFEILPGTAPKQRACSPRSRSRGVSRSASRSTDPGAEAARAQGAASSPAPSTAPGLFPGAKFNWEPRGGAAASAGAQRRYYHTHTQDSTASVARGLAVALAAAVGGIATPAAAQTTVSALEVRRDRRSTG